MNTSADTSPSAAAAGQCRNCGTVLLGQHCYACGQPLKGLVRPLGNLFGDLLDSVFNIDTRIVRTLGPLFTRPGFLSAEYFAGRQVRYVTPVRLFFFLAIITFFVAQLAISGPNINLDAGSGDVGSATSVAEVVKRRDQALAGFEEARQRMIGTPAASGIPGLDAGAEEVRKAAAARIAQLQQAQARGEPPPVPVSDGLQFDVNGKPWDAEKNPLATWLPGFAERWLNQQLVRGGHNIERARKDASALKDAVLASVPSTLFVLVPIFALMLKLAYLFKRRLYMEHVVVALHSHAFLCLDLLLILLVRLLEGALPAGGVLAGLCGWIEGLLFAWMPVYLLLVQKRVYAQGWPLTLLKYCVLGTCYSILLAFAITAALLIGLVAM